MGIIFGLGPVEISILLLMLAPIGVGAFLLHRDVEKLSLGWEKKLLLLISLLIS